MASEIFSAREGRANPINGLSSTRGRNDGGRMELTSFMMSQRDVEAYGANRGYEVQSGNYRATMVDTGMGKRGWQVMDMWVSGGSTREAGPERLYTKSEAERVIRRKFGQWNDRGIR